MSVCFSFLSVSFFFINDPLCICMSLSTSLSPLCVTLLVSLSLYGLVSPLLFLSFLRSPSLSSALSFYLSLSFSLFVSICPSFKLCPLYTLSIISPSPPSPPSHFSSLLPHSTILNLILSLPCYKGNKYILTTLPFVPLSYYFKMPDRPVTVKMSSSYKNVLGGNVVGKEFKIGTF